MKNRPAVPLHDDFDLLVPNVSVGPVRFHPFCHILQRGLQECMVISHHRADDDSFVPFILQVHFGDRDIELAMQARHQRFDPPAFVFEGGAEWKVEVNGESGEQGEIYSWSVAEFSSNLIISSSELAKIGKSS